MKFRLQIASIFTLGLLSSFVIAVLLAVSYFAGYVSWQIMIGLTIFFNFIMWLIGPFISDLIYKWFYKIEFFSYEEIKDYPYMKFIKKVCDDHHMKVPKIGIIKDQNPTAFTYGSAAFNARVVLTEGLFKFLDEKELEAVICHELGHIYNKDFIIMSIATTLLEVLYEVYVIFARSRMRSASASSYTLGKKGKKGGGEGVLILIGYISYFLYWIGTYVVLFLSRLREYYADEFSAKTTGNPNLLSSALVKIAYGIASVPDTQQTAHLLNNTRAQGIFDFKAANEVGLVYLNTKGDKSMLNKALLFDIVSPWAFLMELSSTHPLIGKRIRRLSEMTHNPEFKFDESMKKNVDYSKLWGNFFRDLAVGYSTKFLIVVFIASIILQIVLRINLFIASAGVFFLIWAFLSIFQVQYRFPGGDFAETEVINCMSDLYASPVRGRRVKLHGHAIGRGEAGYIFGEDMIFQDKTGIIYLNYESWIPLFGNFFFAWKKLETLLNKEAVTTGWFFRGATHHIELNDFVSGTEKIQSYAKLWMTIGKVLGIILLAFLLVFISSIFLRIL